MTRALSALVVLLSALLIHHVTLAEEGTWSRTALEGTNLSSIEVTPWSLLAGNETGLWESKDLGSSWNLLGLQSSRVTDIEWSGDSIYATTYYWKNNEVGLYISEDKGATWKHLGDNFSASIIETDGKTLYLGGYSHGLWVSQDNGITWKQKLGTGWYGPGIKSIGLLNGTAFVATKDTVYKSADAGDTFTEIPFLMNKGVSYLKAAGSNIYASGGSGGLYMSKDAGNSWTALQGFGTGKTGAITQVKKELFVCSEILNGYTVFVSSNDGQSWNNTNLNLANPSITCNSMESISSIPDQLFILINADGLYKYQVPENTNIDMVFRIPWNFAKESELEENITSFFDHKYPLAFYPNKQEPENESTTTVNYLGLKEAEPDMYYSSHSGIDFALASGTPILAPADGTAVYYYCGDCGNTIRIDHGRYVTYYMHLQRDGLVTVDKAKGVLVKEGQMIGKVGMTGNATGPHLHFAVIMDKNGKNGIDDDYPDGRADPFGWKNRDLIDPWGVFEWSDTLGTHNGVSSPYMWKTTSKQSTKYINGGPAEVVSDNKIFRFETGALSKGATVEVVPYAIPKVLDNITGTRFISGTSFLVDVLDHYGNKITQLTNPIEIFVSLSEKDIANVLMDSIKLYFWDEILKKWLPLESSYDPKNGILTASTQHFTKFAAFGQEKEGIIPHTDLLVQGIQRHDGTYTQFPTLSFSTSLSGRTYYATNDINWKLYEAPVVLDEAGNIQLEYRSTSTDNIWEDKQIVSLNIAPYGSRLKTVGIRNSILSSTLE